MFSKHVTSDLSAYCHGELVADDARRVGEHVMACARCRAELEEIKFGVKLAEQLPQYSAPATIWPELERMRSTGRTKPSLQVWRPQFVAIAAALLIVVGLAAFLFSRNFSGPSWVVERLDGNP